MDASERFLAEGHEIKSYGERMEDVWGSGSILGEALGSHFGLWWLERGPSPGGHFGGPCLAILPS